MVPQNDLTLVPYAPDLSQHYRQRFDELTDELIEYPEQLDQEVALKDEIKIIEGKSSEGELTKEQVQYLAALEVLLDLIEIGYDVRKNSELSIVPPNTDQYKSDISEFKQHEKDVLQKERQTQFQEQSVRNFIRRMEDDRIYNGNQVSIQSLITNGDVLAEKLAAIEDSSQNETGGALKSVLDPYVQVVESGEKCEKTGMDLMEIWRYFRYTWLTPYNTVPGRNINFLIRNAALEHDPVMGIASLASPMMNLTVRDDYIGWTFDSLKNRLDRQKRVHMIEEQLRKSERTETRKTRIVPNTEWLETEAEWDERLEGLCTATREAMESALAESFDNIRYDDFIENYDNLSHDQFEHPDEEVFKILDEVEQEAEATIEAGNDRNPEKIDGWEGRSKTALFRKKRTRNLKKLLRDRKYFQDHADQSDREFITEAVDNERGKRAVKTALKESKKRRVGAGMMNIMVCGAVRPYNYILGGKLVGMALTGPQVIKAYKEKYEGYESKIASSMKGESVKKPNEVVFYDTTGLFEIGSAQYDRIRVPADTGEIKYEHLGYTEGYGSVQFGPSTRQRLAQVTEIVEGRQVVRGRFGEGVAPRMRKIRRGLTNLGLDGDLLRHESRRVIYGVDLAANATEYLRGETDEPEYYWSFDNPSAEQETIYQHWRERWVSMRIEKPEIIDRIRNFDKDGYLLSADIDFEYRQLSDFIVSNN